MIEKVKTTISQRMEDAAGRLLLVCLIATPILLSCFIIYFFYQPNKKIELKLSSGMTEGTNYKASSELSRIIKEQKTNFNLIIQESSGSLDNFERLENKVSKLALVQSDMPEQKDLRTILPLHPEILHILVKKDAAIEQFKQLEGKVLHLGHEQSGSRHLALKLFEHFGMNINEAKLKQGHPKEAAEKLLNGQIDAILFVAGLKPKLCRDLLETGQVTLIGLGKHHNPGSLIHGFVLDNPFIEPYLIPEGSYTVSKGLADNEPKQAVATVCVRSTLVAHKSLSTTTVYQLLSDIFKWKPSLVRSHPSFASLSEKFNQSNLPYPLHKGADLFFNRERPGFWVKYSEVLSLILSAFIAVIGFCTGVASWLKKRRKEHLDSYFIEIERRMQDIKLAMETGQSTDSISASLFELKQRVIRDLVKERIEAGDGFRTLMALISECEKDTKKQRD